MTNVSSSNNRPAQAAHDLTAALFDVGSAWARYGLGVARMALETSARSLGTTAAALGTLSQAFEEKPQPPVVGDEATVAPEAQAAITTSAEEVQS